MSPLVRQEAVHPLAVGRERVGSVQESVVVQEVERRSGPLELELKSRGMRSGEVEGRKRNERHRSVANEDSSWDETFDPAV